MSAVLRDILDSTKLDPSFCADLVGVSLEQFQEWLNGTRPIARFAIPELSSILGVPEKTLLAGKVHERATANSGSLAPAIWYKLRGDRLTDADREMVGLVRKLGFYINQLQEISSRRSRAFEVLFETIRKTVDQAEPPAQQGRRAAKLFRQATELDHGEVGIGDWVRPTLRKLGVLVLESPVPSSHVEGCAFTVGSEEALTPCLFANSYRSIWFRRNAILLHECAHAIFDLQNEPVSLDFRGDPQAEFIELRAQVFAQECLAPKSVLVRIANKFGLKWAQLDAHGVARLMAESHTEQALVLRSALDNALIDETQFTLYLDYQCDSLVKELTPRALTTREFFKTIVSESPKWMAENRTTTVTRRPLRLPSAYVGNVIDAYRDDEISAGKAAEMLMMDVEVFRDRFSNVVPMAV